MAGGEAVAEGAGAQVAAGGLAQVGEGGEGGIPQGGGCLLSGEIITGLEVTHRIQTLHTHTRTHTSNTICSSLSLALSSHTDERLAVGVCGRPEKCLCI